MQAQYWVIGGEYKDPNFTNVIEGTLQVHGPFGCYSEASTVWREQSMAHRYQAMTRYTIATNASAGNGR